MESRARVLAREKDASLHEDVITRTGEPPRKSSQSTRAVSFSSS